jgi:hypothetical protein
MEKTVTRDDVFTSIFHSLVPPATARVGADKNISNTLDLLAALKVRERWIPVLGDGRVVAVGVVTESARDILMASVYPPSLIATQKPEFYGVWILRTPSTLTRAEEVFQHAHKLHTIPSHGYLPIPGQSPWPFNYISRVVWAPLTQYDIDDLLIASTLPRLMVEEILCPIFMGNWMARHTEILTALRSHGIRPYMVNQIFHSQPIGDPYRDEPTLQNAALETDKFLHNVLFAFDSGLDIPHLRDDKLLWFNLRQASEALRLRGYDPMLDKDIIGSLRRAVVMQSRDHMRDLGSYFVGPTMTNYNGIPMQMIGLDLEAMKMTNPYTAGRCV